MNKNNIITQSFHNKSNLEKSKTVACYNCCKKFEFEKIEEYTDNGLTAICPLCHIDSVIPDENQELSLEFLKECSQYWF